jgi:hypothetical protein
MEHEPEFASLRNLLALKKLEMPLDTEVNRFLIEFHRRQRAALLVPQSGWARALAWVRERAEGFSFVPSISYASGFAALAFMAFLGFSQQVQVTHGNDGSMRLSLRMPAADSSFALIPASFSTGSAAKTNSLTFTPNGAPAGNTHFILANSRVAYDATVAF